MKRVLTLGTHCKGLGTFRDHMVRTSPLSDSVFLSIEWR